MANLKKIRKNKTIKKSLGGWLEDNKGGVMQTVLGAGMMAIPGMQTMGAGMLLKGGSELLGGGQDETTNNYKSPVSKQSQTYQIAEGGMDLTKYEGNTHEEGGIPLGDTGIEVEDGETRVGDMIHSDAITVTKPILKRYSDILKKKDMGKTISTVVKNRNKPFEKRKGDEWNDKAQALVMEPLNSMSGELSEIYNIAKGMNQMAGGGKLPKTGAPIQLPGVDFVGQRKQSPALNEMAAEVKKWASVTPRSGFTVLNSSYQTMPDGTRQGLGHKMDRYIDAMDEKGNSTYYSQEEWDALYPNNPTRQLKTQRGGGKIPSKALKLLGKGRMHTRKESNNFMYEAEGGFDLTDGGNAPIVGSAIGLLGSMMTPAEEVKYEQMRFTPTQTTALSADPGISKIKQSFGDSKASLRRLNPRGYLSSMNQLAAKEAEAIGDYSGNISNANVESANRAAIYDSQNRIRVDSTNAQIGMQEAEANAANRGMKKTATNAYLNNLATQIGQKAADDKAYDMQDKYQKGMLEVYNKYADLSKPIPSDNEEIKSTSSYDAFKHADMNLESESFDEAPIPGTYFFNKQTGMMEKRKYSGPLNRLRTYKKFKTY